MTELEKLRHSCAHVLATAILRIWPQTQFAAGPPVENGFYYDLELDHRISTDDLEKIEREMKKVVKENQLFERIVVSRQKENWAPAPIVAFEELEESLPPLFGWSRIVE